MSSNHFCIKISSDISEDIHEIKFFETDTWTLDTEKQLISRIQELLPVLRTLTKTFQITLNANVTDTDRATSLIRKKISGQVEINNQKLSLREIEVLGLIMQGCTNNEIGEKLFISYETVKSHRKNILEKTGAKNTAALINYYHQTFFEK